METDLKFRPFRSPADPGWDEAWAIYQNSFPQKEIRSLEDHLQALSDPHYTADGIWSDGRLIGILYYWTAPEYVYIEHLAISPDLRGANMGSRVLEAFCRKAGRIVLEIDPPETEIAVRRLRFYERLGFVRNSDAMAIVSVAPIVDELRSGELRIIDIEGCTIRREFSFCWPEGRSDALAARFVEFARHTA